VKRTYRFIESSGIVVCSVDGVNISLPIFAGILKHPTIDQLEQLLTDPAVARKYTHAALRTAPWCAVRCFPRAWLRACLPDANVPEGRRKALEFLLEGHASRT
jgi:hypothetical protein